MYAILAILLLTDAGIVCTVALGMTGDITTGIASAYIIGALVLVQGALCIFGWMKAKRHDRSLWGMLFIGHTLLSVAFFVLTETGLIYDLAQSFT